MECQVVTLHVPGMYCPKCEERIAMTLDRLPGVTLVQADHVRGEVIIRLAGDRAPLAEVRRRIEDLGFSVAPGDAPEQGDPPARSTGNDNGVVT